MKHITILRAKKGEFDALRNLDVSTSDRILPLFDISRITDAGLSAKYMSKSKAPISAHLDRVMDGISEAWPKRPAMIDIYRWKPDSLVENGSHLLDYLLQGLSRRGLQILPVIGYDRWQDVVYRQALVRIFQSENHNCCIRLDNSALEDLAESDLLSETLREMVDFLEIIPSQSYVLIDFDDVSIPNKSVEALLSQGRQMLSVLNEFSFKGIFIAGCSIPKTINLAVQDHDSVCTLLRKEMLIWQTLRQEYPNANLFSGDYGVRGPTTTEAPSKYTNGKIRYAIKGGVFIARGHPFITDGGKFFQMHGLAARVASSKHFLGEKFSWGDSQILYRMASLKPGSLSDWIAVDTNHHLSLVVSEVEEFEMNLLIASAAKK